MSHAPIVDDGSNTQESLKRDSREAVRAGRLPEDHRPTQQHPSNPNRVFIMAGEDGLEGPTPETENMSTQTMTNQSSAPSITVPLGTPLSVAARELILSTLHHCGGERKRTAEMLGICTKTLYNRLREYGIREEHRSTFGEVTRTQ